jgi:CubicO group peptidase (beta-lactamase class C family)
MKSFQKKSARFYFIVPILFVLIIISSRSFASPSYYPTQGWRETTPEQQGIQTSLLADMLEEIKNNSYNVDSIIVVRNGYKVLDAYFYPFSRGQKHNIHSCTKSIMSALIGIAIEKGFIKGVNQPIGDFFHDIDFSSLDDHKKSITLKDCLMMATGLDCRDSYLYGWKGLEEMRFSPDWAQYVLDLPMSEPPGEKFNYCNGVSYLLSVIIQNATRMRTLDFARENLFNPLGISDIRWETSPQGIEVGYGRMWLKAEDMAKFGLLYLNRGKWEQNQIVPAAWVDESTRGQIDATLFDKYGYHWWVDSEGFYMAVGYKGQLIFVVPSKRIVVVFTSDLTGGDFGILRKLLVDNIIPAASSSVSLPENSEATARLVRLVKSAATASPDGFVWLTKAAGEAKNGLFKRIQAPKFMFEYPATSKKMRTMSPDQIMRMKTPQDVEFAASVIDIPQGIALEAFGPRFYASALKYYGAGIEVIANKRMTLKCGTVAYRTDIKWLWNDQLTVTSIVVSTYRNGQCVYLAVHPMSMPERFTWIVESLTFIP